MSYTRHLAAYLPATVVDPTGQALLGGLAGTVIGTREVGGTVTKDYGALVGTVAGTRTVSGTAVKDLGGLLATALALGPPAALHLLPVTSTRIDLSWPVGSGEVGFYELERERWNGSSWVESTTFSYLLDPPGNVPALSYSDTTLTAGQQYRYRVRSVFA